MDHLSTENLTAERLREDHLADLATLHLDAIIRLSVLAQWAVYRSVS